MVFALVDIKPKGIETHVATKSHHQTDVATVGNGSVEQSVGDAAPIETGVGFGHHDHPFTGLDQSVPFKGRTVHCTDHHNSVSFHTCHWIERDARINEAISVHRVGDRSSHVNRSSTDFNVTGIWAVQNNISGGIFFAVVDGFKSFFHDGHVVIIANGDEEAPNTVSVGHYRFVNRGGVARHSDVKFRNSFGCIWCVVVIEVPIDLAADFNLE